MQTRARVLALHASVGLAMMSGTGCITQNLLYQTEKTTAAHPQAILQDRLLAIGQPDPASLQKLGAAHALVFLGEQRSYLVVEGSEALGRIAHEPGSELIDIESDSRCPWLYVQGDQFWGDLRLRAARPDASPAGKVAQARLIRLGFSAQSENYSMDIHVKGSLGLPLQLPEAKRQAIRPRPIAFFPPPAPPPGATVKRVVLLPLSVALDIATLPIQALGLLMVPIAFQDPGTPLNWK